MSQKVEDVSSLTGSYIQVLRAGRSLPKTQPQGRARPPYHWVGPLGPRAGKVSTTLSFPALTGHRAHPGHIFLMAGMLPI
jgi:hypothetical protein